MTYSLSSKNIQVDYGANLIQKNYSTFGQLIASTKNGGQ